MIDLNRLAGFVYTCPRESSSKLKEALVKIAVTAEADDLFIVGEEVAKGPGEATSLFSNYKLPLTIDNFNRFTNYAIKTLGGIDCDGSKMVFVISHEFNDEFRYQLAKLLKMAETHYYETKYFVFHLSDSEDDDISSLQEKFEHLEYQSFNSMDVLSKQMLETYEQHETICEVDNGENNEV